MTLACILFASAAMIWPLGRILKKNGIPLPLFSVLLSCAGVAAEVLGGGTVTGAAAGTAVVLLAALLAGEGGEKE